MSILIKMEMPKNCDDCFAEAFGYCRALKYNPSEPNFRAISDSMTRREDCPLTELPPHGRLIDADALNKDIEHSVVFSARQQKQNAEIRGAFKVYDRIKVAPTIIEAEGEDGKV